MEASKSNTNSTQAYEMITNLLSHDGRVRTPQSQQRRIQRLLTAAEKFGGLDKIELRRVWGGRHSEYRDDRILLGYTNGNAHQVGYTLWALPKR